MSFTLLAEHLSLWNPFQRNIFPTGCSFTGISRIGKISLYTDNTETAQKVDFEQSKILLANAITKENKELGLDENSEEARSVYKIELVFADNGEVEYIPVWYYEMEDGRTYYVNCIDGQVTGL